MRLLAWFVDTMIVTVISLAVSIPLAVWFLSTRMSRLADLGPNPDFSQLYTEFFLPLILINLIIVAFTLVCYYVYNVELMHRSGQTPGKRIAKIRVVPIDPAATLTRGMAVKRYLIEIVGGTLIPYFRYVDGLWQLWDKPFQQTLHDKVAKTVVVKVSA